MPPKQNPGQQPTRKIMAAATGVKQPDAARLVKRTKPPVLAMPGRNFRHPAPPAIPKPADARKPTSKASIEGSTPQTGKPAKPKE